MEAEKQNILEKMVKATRLLEEKSPHEKYRFHSFYAGEDWEVDFECEEECRQYEMVIKSKDYKGEIKSLKGNLKGPLPGAEQVLDKIIAEIEKQVPPVDKNKKIIKDIKDWNIHDVQYILNQYGRGDCEEQREWEDNWKNVDLSGGEFRHNFGGIYSFLGMMAGASNLQFENVKIYKPENIVVARVNRKVCTRRDNPWREEEYFYDWKKSDLYYAVTKIEGNTMTGKYFKSGPENKGLEP